MRSMSNFCAAAVIAAAGLWPCAAWSQTDITLEEGEPFASVLGNIATGDVTVTFVEDNTDADDEAVWEVPMAISIKHEIVFRGTSELPTDLVLQNVGGGGMFDIQDGGSLII